MYSHPRCIHVLSARLLFFLTSASTVPDANRRGPAALTHGGLEQCWKKATCQRSRGRSRREIHAGDRERKFFREKKVAEAVILKKERTKKEIAVDFFSFAEGRLSVLYEVTLRRTLLEVKSPRGGKINGRA